MPTKKKAAAPVTDTPETTQADTNTTTGVRSTLEKLVAAKALVAKYERELKQEEIREDIQVGDTIVFMFGRGDKKRELTGKVLGTKRDEAQGLMIRAEVGEGFDAETFKTFVRDVVTNVSGDERRAAESGEAEQAPSDDGSDPLDSAE